MLRFFALSISATLGLVLTLGACGSDMDAGASDAAADASDASTLPEVSLGGCLCAPANARENPAGCPAAFNLQEVLNKPCATPGLVCTYTDDVARCNCGVDVQCRVDPRADAGTRTDGGEDGGDEGVSLVWQTGK